MYHNKNSYFSLEDFQNNGIDYGVVFILLLYFQILLKISDKEKKVFNLLYPSIKLRIVLARNVGIRNIF